MKISDATRKRVLRLADGGASASAIMERVHICLTTVLRIVAMDRCPTLAGNGPGRPRTLDHDTVLVELAGTPVPEIAARQMGKKASIYGIAARAGVKRHETHKGTRQ